MIDQLLNDVPPIIAGYLTYLDVINLSCTCNQVRSQLSLNVTSPRPLLSVFLVDVRSDDVHHGFKLPVIVQVPVHSMLISMTWSDQGWGNRKGRIFLVAEKTNETYGSLGRHTDGANPCIAYNRSEQFSGRRVVFSSGLAPHGEEKLKITFQPRERETYHLFYVTGGGGGHSLDLKDVKMQTLLFGDSSRRLVKAHDFLARSNVSRPWDGEGFQADAMKTIVASTSYSITHGLRILPPILSFFDGRGISEADLTGDKGGQLMDMIESLWNDWDQERSDYSPDNIANDDEPVMGDNIFFDDEDDDDMFGVGEHDGYSSDDEVLFRIPRRSGSF